MKNFFLGFSAFLIVAFLTLYAAFLIMGAGGPSPTPTDLPLGLINGLGTGAVIGVLLAVLFFYLYLRQDSAST